MAVLQSENPISQLSKAEIIKRSLEYVTVPLSFYVKTVLARSLTEEQIEAVFTKSNGSKRRVMYLDAPSLIEVTTNSIYKNNFVELQSLSNHLHKIRMVRNQWAHQDSIDDATLWTFLLACEAVVTAIVTDDFQPALDQIRSLRGCWILFVAEKTFQEFTQVDENGNSFLLYPALLPAFEE